MCFVSSASRVRCICRWKAFVRALSGVVRANCDCHVSLCLLLQGKVAALKRKCSRNFKICCDDEDLSTRDSIRIDEIAEGAACCEPPHPATAILFCLAMFRLALDCEGSAVYEKIASTGGIPAIVQLVARLPDEKEVVRMGCAALGVLAGKGSASIKSLILAQPDVISLLRAASPRLRAWGKNDSAAMALKALGV